MCNGEFLGAVSQQFCYQEDLWLAEGGAQSETSLASSSFAVHDGKNSELSSKILKADDVAHGHKSVLRGESGCNF